MHNSFDIWEDSWRGCKQLDSRRFVSSISAVVHTSREQPDQAMGTVFRRCVLAPLRQWHSLASRLGFLRGHIHQCVRWLSPPPGGHHDVFGIGVDGDLKHARHTAIPEAWKPGYRSWTLLGGFGRRSTKTNSSKYCGYVVTLATKREYSIFSPFSGIFPLFCFFPPQRLAEP